MKFKILSADAEDALEWECLINTLPSSRRDIHYLPAYGRIYRETYGQEPLLAFYGTRDAFVIQPFVIRKLESLPCLTNHIQKQCFIDIANPYGFGGALTNHLDRDDAQGLMAEFAELFVAYGQHANYASEFTCLHPILGNHTLMCAVPSVALQAQKEVIVVDVSGGETSIWAGLNRGHRSAVNKARRAGVSVERVEPSAGHLAIFMDLYYQTMERNAAAERWYFPRRYFSDCVEQLGTHRTSLFFASVDGKVAAAHMLMHDFETVYYHFGGSDERFNDIRPSSLLVYEEAIWASQQGYHHFHLGGGVTASEDDSLFRFKAGFSKQTKTLYTYGRVLNDTVYQELCTLKQEHEVRTYGRKMDSNYFPLYRR